MKHDLKGDGRDIEGKFRIEGQKFVSVLAIQRTFFPNTIWSDSGLIDHIQLSLSEILS
jgi:hypothetical protein